MNGPRVGAMTARTRDMAGAALLTALLLAPWHGEAASTRFVVRPEQSKATYVTGTQLGEFSGETRSVEGEILFDPQEPARLTLSVSVDLRTLKSDNAKRDQHMYDQPLETERFPVATLTASQVSMKALAGGAGEGLLVGTFKLHGVERPVSVPIRFVLDRTTLRGDGAFIIALGDFGMTPPRLLGLKVRDQVKVEVRLVATSP